MLRAHGAYHGSDPCWTPSLAGITSNERADLIEFDYNDLTGAEAAAARADGDVAAIIVTPFRRDAFKDQVLAGCRPGAGRFDVRTGPGSRSAREKATALSRLSWFLLTLVQGRTYVPGKRIGNFPN